WRTQVHGPDITWYVVLAGMLFAIGAVGVLIRRSPLIILLSVEVMLNGANLALIAFARPAGHADGQGFAITVMAAPPPAAAVARLGGRGRPRADRGHGPPQPRARRRQAPNAARMRSHR